MKNLNFMRSIDELLLSQLEKFKETAQYQKVLDQYNLLEEWEQSIANAVLMAVTILLPLIFILIFYSFFSSVKNDVTIKEQIVTTASSIIAESSQVRSKSNQVFGQEIPTENILKNRISSSLSSAGIDSAKVKVSNFDLTENAGINELNAQIQFNGFSSVNIYAFIKSLLVTGKYKVREVLVEKNINTNLLDGKFDLSYYSKVVINDNE